MSPVNHSLPTWHLNLIRTLADGWAAEDAAAAPTPYVAPVLVPVASLPPPKPNPAHEPASQPRVSAITPAGKIAYAGYDRRGRSR